MFLIPFFFSVFGFSTSVELALNWKPEPQFGGFYEALFEGYFEKEGLQVKIIEGGSGTPTIQMIDSRKINFGIVSADEIILSHDRGSKETVALFATYQINPQGIMLHKDSTIKNFESLFSSEKDTLLWQSGLPYALYLKKKYAPIKIKEAPYTGGIGLFSQNKNYAQQCFVTSEPLLAEKNNVPNKAILIADSGFNPYTTVLATNQKYLKSNPEVVKKMVNAVRKGWESYLKAPQKTNLKMFALNKSMDLQTFQKSSEAQKKLIQPDAKIALGSMTEQRWQTLIDQLKSVGTIKNPIDAKTLFTN